MALLRTEVNSFANSATAYPANEWFSAAAVFTSATSRQAFLNGIGGAINTDSATPDTIPDRMGIGVLWHNAAWSYGIYGQMDFAAIWSRALSASEVAELSYDPYALVRPPSTMTLFAGMGGGVPPVATGYNLTQLGSALLRRRRSGLRRLIRRAS